jgi:hypothetical protein
MKNSRKNPGFPVERAVIRDNKKVVENSSIHREPRKIITGFHQEILLLKKVRNWNTPKGREGVRGNRGFPLVENDQKIENFFRQSFRSNQLAKAT